jgi:phage shock protein PspC (stress-responsive transcriptional regulator)
MQNVQTTNEQAPETRSIPDSLFGVCESIGRDFGFNALFLRLAFLILGLFSIPASIGAYALLGIGVAASRWLFPANPDSQSETASSHLHEAANEEADRELLAA